MSPWLFEDRVKPPEVPLVTTFPRYPVYGHYRNERGPAFPPESPPILPLRSGSPLGPTTYVSEAPGSPNENSNHVLASSASSSGPPNYIPETSSAFLPWPSPYMMPGSSTSPSVISTYIPGPSASPPPGPPTYESEPSVFSSVPQTSRSLQQTRSTSTVSQRRFTYSDHSFRSLVANPAHLELDAPQRRSRWIAIPPRHLWLQDSRRHYYSYGS